MLERAAAVANEEARDETKHLVEDKAGSIAQSVSRILGRKTDEIVDKVLSAFQIRQEAERVENAHHEEQYLSSSTGSTKGLLDLNRCMISESRL